MRRPHIAALSILVCLSTGIAVPAGSSQAVAQDPAYAPHPGFTFRDGRSRAVDVTLADAKGVVTLTWPETAGEWVTALLRVQATADPAAVMPYVEMSAAGVSHRQYFPASDSGQRWLNLHFLRGTL